MRVVVGVVVGVVRMIGTGTGNRARVAVIVMRVAVRSIRVAADAVINDRQHGEAV